MNQDTVSLPAVAIARLTAAVATLPGVRFVGVTYRSKESNELARHVLILGASYENTVENSLAILRTRECIAIDASTTRILQEGIDVAKTRADNPKADSAERAEWKARLAEVKRTLKTFQSVIGAERAAAAELFVSLENSLTGENLAYTKAGLYENICPGLKVSRSDGTFELCGMAHSKVVLEQGTFRPVNSSEKTLAKQAIRKTLPIGKYRTLSLDAGALESVRIGGSEISVADV